MIKFTTILTFAITMGSFSASTMADNSLCSLGMILGPSNAYDLNDVVHRGIIVYFDNYDVRKQLFDGLITDVTDLLNESILYRSLVEKLSSKSVRLVNLELSRNEKQFSRKSDFIVLSLDFLVES